MGRMGKIFVIRYFFFLVAAKLITFVMPTVGVTALPSLTTVEQPLATYVVFGSTIESGKMSGTAGNTKRNIKSSMTGLVLVFCRDIFIAKWNI